MVAEQIPQQILLRDYEENEYYYAEYDFSDVRALQTDERELYDKLNIGVQGGWITIAEARSQVGLPTNEGQDIYYVSNSVIPTQADMGMPEQEEIEAQEQEQEVVTEDMEDNEEKSFEDKIVR